MSGVGSMKKILIRIIFVSEQKPQKYFTNTTNKCVQPVRVCAVAVLGVVQPGGHRPVRHGGSGQLHPLLGPPHVWKLLRHQRDRAAQPPHRHDVLLLRAHLCEYTLTS